MANTIDLSRGFDQLSQVVVVDTNVIVESLAWKVIGFERRARATQSVRAKDVIDYLDQSGKVGLVVPTVFKEFVHLAIKGKYEDELSRLRREPRSAIARPINSWVDLYKQAPEILRTFSSELQHARGILIASGLLIVLPEELQAIPSGRPFDTELIHLTGHYGLDSDDALILMETQRLGLTDILTFDPDMRRAQEDFNIYTWF